MMRREGFDCLLTPAAGGEGDADSLYLSERRGPRMGLTRTETPDLVFEPGMVFTLKPRVVIKGTRPAAQFGDAVLVTDTGARRLGKRKLELITAG